MGQGLQRDPERPRGGLRSETDDRWRLCFAGYTDSLGVGEEDMYVVKTDRRGYVTN